ncbi:unnamed protein product, partial [Mesorhabditis spiculigera]
MLRLRALRPVERVKREWPFPVINDVYPGCCLQALPINYPFEDMRRSRANHPAEFFQPVSYRIRAPNQAEGRFYDHMPANGSVEDFIDVESTSAEDLSGSASAEVQEGRYEEISVLGVPWGQRVLMRPVYEKRPRGRPKNVKISLNRPIRVGSPYYLDDKPRLPIQLKTDDSIKSYSFVENAGEFRPSLPARVHYSSGPSYSQIVSGGYESPHLEYDEAQLESDMQYHVHDNQEIDIYGAPMDDYGQDLATHSGVDYGTEYITGDAVNHLPVVEDVEVKTLPFEPTKPQPIGKPRVRVVKMAGYTKSTLQSVKDGDVRELYYVNGSGKTTFVRVGAPPKPNPMTQHAEELPVEQPTKAGYAGPPRRTIRILKRLPNARPLPY